VILQLQNFFIPLQLHRKTVQQIAALDLKHLTSLSRLLQEQAFVDAFHEFLKKEFSSENLFFWLEVDKIQTKYLCLLQPESKQHSQSGSRSSSASASSRALRVEAVAPEGPDPKLVHDAAAECVDLGTRCIGDDAPCKSIFPETQLKIWGGACAV